MECQITVRHHVLQSSKWRAAPAEFIYMPLQTNTGQRMDMVHQNDAGLWTVMDPCLSFDLRRQR